MVVSLFPAHWCTQTACAGCWEKDWEEGWVGGWILGDPAQFEETWEKGPIPENPGQVPAFGNERGTRLIKVSAPRIPSVMILNTPPQS